MPYGRARTPYRKPNWIIGILATFSLHPVTRKSAIRRNRWYRFCFALGFRPCPLTVFSVWGDGPRRKNEKEMKIFFIPFRDSISKLSLRGIADQKKFYFILLFTNLKNVIMFRTRCFSDPTFFLNKYSEQQ